MTDQAEPLRVLMNHRPEGPLNGDGTARVIAVASGKGGVGKTNFCVNFALALQKAGHRPIVIDADVGFANVEVLLGIRPSRTIMDILSGAEIWDVIQQGDSGLPFLSAGNGLLDIHSLSYTQMDRILSQMSLLHERYDIVLIDSGAGLGSNVSRLLCAADDLIVVTTPEPTAITDAYSLLKLLVARGELPPTRLVVNRAASLVDAKLAADKLRMVADRFLGVELVVLGYILEDAAVSRSVMQQEALLKAHPNSSAARCVTQIAQNYMRSETSVPKHGVTGFLDRLFRRFRPTGEVDSGHPA